jgi:hypothetical protein
MPVVLIDVIPGAAFVLEYRSILRGDQKGILTPPPDCLEVFQGVVQNMPADGLASFIRQLASATPHASHVSSSVSAEQIQGKTVLALLQGFLELLVTAKLDYAIMATTITRLIVSIITLFAIRFLDECIPAVFGLACRIAAVTRILIAVIAEFAFVLIPISTVADSPAIKAAIIASFSVAIIAALSYFFVYHSIAACFIRCAIGVTPVAGPDISVIADFHGVLHSVPTR